MCTCVRFQINRLLPCTCLWVQSWHWTGVSPINQHTVSDLPVRAVWLSTLVVVIMVTQFALQISKADCFVFTFLCIQERKHYYSRGIFKLVLSKNTSLFSKQASWHRVGELVMLIQIWPGVSELGGYLRKRDNKEVIRSQSLGGPFSNHSLVIYPSITPPRQPAAVT